MCGRTAQTQAAVMTAASSLSAKAMSGRGLVIDNIGPRVPESGDEGSLSGNSSKHQSSHTTKDNNQNIHPSPPLDGVYPWRSNFNLSPGHDAVVFTFNKETGAVEMDRKIWGLVTKGGSQKNPLPKGPSKHFANLMFNARSDTLFSKPTFARLLNEGKTCVVAFDGFFEWKADVLGGGKGKKQPYYVFRKDTTSTDNNNQKSPLLMAGLWTSVTTGWEHQPTLDTFTILTTEVCDPLKWLHSRMPVTLWEDEMALQWMKDPSVKLHQKIDTIAHNTPESRLGWYAVSTQMSSTKYRGQDAIKALPKHKSVKSFFAASPVKKMGVGVQKSDNNTAVSHSIKGATSTAITIIKVPKSSPVSEAAKKRTTGVFSPEKPPAPKKAKITKSTPPANKKGTITSFFAPKNY